MVLIREAVPADAAEIVALLIGCYGQTYTVESAQDPAAVASRIRSRAEIYSVAETSSGLVGFGVLAQKGRGLFEYYRCVVHERARGQGLMRRLISHAIAQAERLGAALIRTGLVTSHRFAQRSVAPLGFSPLGLVLGLIPEYTTLSGIGTAAQPVSLVLLGRCLERDPRPRRLHLPAVERERARAILKGLGIPCSTSRSRRRLVELGWRLERDPAIGLAWVRFSTHEQPTPHEELLIGLEAGEHRVLWVDVPAETAAASALCESIRDRGYGWAGYLPRSGPAGEDVVRFQAYLDPAPLTEEGVEVLPAWEGLRHQVYADLFTRSLSSEGVLS